MRFTSWRTPTGGSTAHAVPADLVAHVLGVSSVRPGVVDSAQRRLALAPLPTSLLLAASMVDVLVAGRRS